jgi:hypothetical protein
MIRCGGMTQAFVVAPRFVADRYSGNPIITPAMMGNPDENINGPSLMRVPAWVRNPLGRYYLYFAHHEGSHIRLAYADSVQGPWRIYAPGVLHTGETGWNPDHVASPDVLIDEERRQIRLYFHAPVTPVPKSTDPDYHQKLLQAKQESFLALSSDGLRFEVRRESLGPSYFRVWRWKDHYYAFPRLGKPLLRSRDGMTGFERAARSPFDDDPAFHDVRHVAVRVQGDTLTVFYTRIGDAPEHICCTTIAMSSDWETWRATPPMPVLHPEHDYEGAALPVAPSLRGAATCAEHAVRDPAVYEEDGMLYLLYSVAGERGIALATLRAAAP